MRNGKEKESEGGGKHRWHLPTAYRLNSHRRRAHDHLPSSSPPGWHSSRCFRKTGQIPRKTHPCHKCKVALPFLCFFGKNKMMYFLIM